MAIWIPKLCRRRSIAARRPSSAPVQRLLCEALEDRRLLAGTDMAQITGTVYHDINGDQLNNDTAPLNGVTVRLFADNGNNLFGPEDASIQSVTTDGSGRYTFDGVSAGRYYIQQQAPNGFIQRVGEDVQTVDISAAEAMGSDGVTIDQFSTEQSVEASPPLPASSPSNLNDGLVLGGERDLFVELTGGTDRFSSVSLISGDDRLRLRSDTEVTGNAKVVWDGADGNGRDVDAGGLAGVDLTEANGNTMTGVALTAGADQAGAQLQLRFYTDANNWSEFHTTVPQTPGGAPTGQVLIHFADAPDTTSGSGANFANIGAVELTFVGVSALDGQVSLIGTVGVTTKTADFANYEPLSLGNLVWLDRNNSGQFDAGDETGIAGVQLNLYEDADQDEQFTRGVDSFLATTDTNAAGNYLFSNLLPGKYLVQVDESNFDTGGPLNDLGSSTGNQPTPDPDNNVNHDDNGDPVAGVGVLASSVMLMANSEPVNDEDSDSDSNLSVDFGFFAEADLALTKSVDNETPFVGETVTFTVVLANQGPNRATGVAVDDPLPAGLTFVSSSPSQGVYSHITGTWDVGSVENGGQATLQIRARVDSLGMKMNTAQVSSADQLDRDSMPNNNLLAEDDQDKATVTPAIADLAIAKIVDDATPAPGQNVAFTITLTNEGNSQATGVQVEDLLPSGLTFISSTPSQGSYSAGTGRWDVGSISASVQATLLIVARVDTGGVKMNMAEVVAMDQPDIDSTPGNGLASEDDKASVTLTPPSADLSLAKSLDNSTPLANERVTFTVVARNDGPETATGVVVNDPVPLGLSFVSASANQGNYDRSTGNWNVGTLQNGATATLTVVVQATSPGKKTNIAEITAADQFDTDSTPNNGVDGEDDQAMVMLTPQEADLSLTKTVNNTRPAIGETVTFTVNVRNDGPSTGTSLAVADRLPPGLTYVSSTASRGSYEPATGTWTIGTLAVGEQVTMQIRATVDTRGLKDNTAQVSSLDQFDRDSTVANFNANEDDQDNAQVRPFAPLLGKRRFLS